VNIPFVTLDSLAFEVSIDEKDQKFLDCKMFSMDKFLSHYRIKDPIFLHLMSSVLGNDYIPASSFERFFSQIRLPKKKSMSPRHKES
jgi:hypothetical protein